MFIKSKKPFGEIKKKNLKQLKDYCVWLLARKNYSEFELRGKLKKYAENQSDIDTVIEQMLEYKYIDDSTYALSLFRSEVQKGHGLMRLKQSFQSKGVDIATVQAAVDDVNWFQAAYDLKVKKFGIAIASDEKQKAKQIRFLQYRGFSLDVVLKVIKYIPE